MQIAISKRMTCMRISEWNTTFIHQNFSKQNYYSIGDVCVYWEKKSLGWQMIIVGRLNIRYSALACAHMSLDLFIEDWWTIGSGPGRKSADLGKRGKRKKKNYSVANSGLRHKSRWADVVNAHRLRFIDSSNFHTVVMKPLPTKGREPKWNFWQSKLNAPTWYTPIFAIKCVT